LRFAGFAMPERIGAAYAEPVSPRILVIDNYDSFVYNLVQYLGELGAEPIVHRDDAITVDDVEALDVDGILISPGPGTPADAGVSNDVIRELGHRRPVFGVCLGMQCIGEVFGGRVVRAPEVVHGKTSPIHHRGVGVFEGLPNPLEATRYHSLIVERSSLPDVLEVTAETDDGLVMGLRHRELMVEGVQFHPESVLTAAGHDLVRNFLGRCAAPA
jgi:anthranilate synthase component 2